MDADPPKLAVPPVLYVKADTAKGPPVLLAPKAPAVATARATTFQNGGYWKSHACPACGRQQLDIASGTKYSRHVHVCSDPRCRTAWTH